MSTEKLPPRAVRNSAVISTTIAQESINDDDGELLNVNEFQFIKKLGEGSFAEVRLAQKTATATAPDVMPYNDDDRQGGKYAVKIFNKSVLKRNRTMVSY